MAFVPDLIEAFCPATGAGSRTTRDQSLIQNRTETAASRPPKKSRSLTPVRKQRDRVRG
jgi:hypothetical protein